jgi:hypothetical protein
LLNVEDATVLIGRLFGRREILAVGNQQTRSRVLQKKGAAVSGKRRVEHKTDFARFQHGQDCDEERKLMFHQQSDRLLSRSSLCNDRVRQAIRGSV